MDLQDVALGIAHLCVRNTIIEEYHADGKLTDKEMKAFNREVANKLFTALLSMTSPDMDVRQAAYSLFAGHRPANWDPHKSIRVSEGPWQESSVSGDTGDPGSDLSLVFAMRQSKSHGLDGLRFAFSARHHKT